MTRAHEGLPVSIQVRLARHARELGMDPNRVLTRFAAERFLYRLSCSPFETKDILKARQYRWDADVRSWWRELDARMRYSARTGKREHRKL